MEVQGAFLEANGSCEFIVGFIVPTGLTPGDYTNTTSELNAATGVESFPVNAPAATATLTVDAADAPVFTKAFSPDTIAPGGISRLTFTIDNRANLIDVGSLAFTDAFPAGLVVAGTPQRVDDLRRDICARGVGCLACLCRRRCCGRGRLRDFR